MVPYLEPGGKDFAKLMILIWLNNTGGSNLKLLETATGLPVDMLQVLLDKLVTEGNVSYEKHFPGRKVWRVK